MQNNILIYLVIIILALVMLPSDIVKFGTLAVILTAVIFMVIRPKNSGGDDIDSDDDSAVEELPDSDNSGGELADTEDNIIPPLSDDHIENFPAEERNPYPWMENEEYGSCYPPVAVDLNNCNKYAYLPFDEANARLSALRQRDKKALDGAVTKNANYYKKHFSRELNEAENERWWGNDEY